ncbi:hypothetical protein AYM40_07145 [Paraburkholderia phytofirmans OLGA172]|uniref:Uncharacterized protein n=1 Tax=Paraburkholderia phytofirmans OLGA172 TaxID=1417228 RepID=A0A160FJN3_9BURK|nr:hypothetical protein AYM40_07145 [Paraburkholderia phytofirmans OLGA172]
MFRASKAGPLATVAKTDQRCLQFLPGLYNEDDPDYVAPDRFARFACGEKAASMAYSWSITEFVCAASASVNVGSRRTKG